jgi:flagellin-like protein
VSRDDRGQSTVVGAALLVALTVVAVAGTTAAVGTVIEDRAAAAGADRAVAGFDDALATERGGPGRERLALPGGDLRVVERTVRIRGGGLAVALDVGGLVYEADAGDRRITAVAGTTLRSGPTGADLVGPVPVRVRGDDLFVSVAVLGVEPGLALDADAVAVRTDVGHERRRLPPASYRFAVESDHPSAWVDRLDRLGPTTVRDLDGDGTPSAVVEPRVAGPLRLVIHRLDAEVRPA